MVPASSRPKTMAQFMWNIRVPLGLVGLLAALPIVSYKSDGALWLPSFAVLLLMRLALVGWAGYLTTSRLSRGMWSAAAAGGLLFLVEQAVVVLWFLTDGQGEAALRVIFTFAMFFWLPAAVAASGGLFGQQRSRV